MMKSFKHAIYFIIPYILLSIIKLVLTIATYISNYASLNTPSFGGIQYYIKLFFQDCFAFKALLNSFISLIAFALLLSAISLSVVAFKSFIGSKNTKAYFICLTVSAILGIIAKFTVSFQILQISRFSLITLFSAIQSGVFSAFIFWIGDKIINRKEISKNADAQ